MIKPTNSIARVLLISLLLTSTHRAQSAKTPNPVVTVKGDIGAKLDSLLSRYEQYGLSGTFLIAKDGQIVLHKGYGFANRKRRIPNSPATLFEMGSITKTFTAAAILRLEMQGKLKTDDLISKYLGEFPRPKSSATIFHLLAHKAGLTVEGANLNGDGSDRDRFIQDIKDTPAESVPGEKYRYTNAGFSVLAAIVEKVSGQTFESFVREQLFISAGLAHTGFRGDFAGDNPRIARGYLGTPEKIEEGPPLPYPWGTRGAGGIIATVADMYQWLLALQGNAILSGDAKRKAFAPAPSEQYGWHVGASSRGTPSIDKGGGQVNFATHILFFPAEKLTIVYASNNLQQRWRRTLNANLPKVALGDKVDLPPPTLRMRPVVLNRDTGHYVTEAGETFEVRTSDNYLYLTGNASLPTSLLFFPTSRNQFTAVDTLNLRIVSLSFDQAHNVAIRSAGMDVKASRVRRAS